MQSPNFNLQSVKLRAIARGLGAELIFDRQRQDFFIRWDECLTARVFYGGWQRRGRIVFQAHHPYRYHECPEITVSATRPVKAIVRDVQNRFITDAREFCRKCMEMQHVRETKEKAERDMIQSFLDELGADYDDAKTRGSRTHSADFSARGVRFSSYYINREGNCEVTLKCSAPCLRQVLRLVRADYEFHQPIQAKAEAEENAKRAKRRAQILAKKKQKQTL